MNPYEVPEFSSRIKGKNIPPLGYESFVERDKNEFLRRINDFGKRNPDFASSIEDIRSVLTTLPTEDILAFNKIYTSVWENDLDAGFRDFCSQIERHVASIDPYDIDKKIKDKRTILKEALQNYLVINGWKEQKKLKIN